MKNFFEIIMAEFRTFASDKGMQLIMLIGVIVYSLFYSVPYANEVVKEVPCGVVDFDQTSASREFIRDIDTTDYIHIVEKFSSKEEAQKAMYKGKISGFVTIPKDFQKNIKKGKQTNVGLYTDSAFIIIYKAVYTGVVQTAVETGKYIEISRLLMCGVPKQTAISLSQPFEFIQVPLYNPAGGYETYVYPVILIVILHQTLIVALSMLQGTRNEKKIRLCKNDKEIPFTLFARATFYLILYLIYGAFIFLICPALCRYPMTYNLLPLFVLYVLMIYSAVFFAQTISYSFRTRETSLMILVVTSLIFVFLPGLIWPKESIPFAVNLISLFIPAISAIDGITKVNVQGASFWQINSNVFWLLFLTLFYFICSVFLTKKIYKEFDEK